MTKFLERIDLKSIQKLKFYEMLPQGAQRNINFLIMNPNNTKVFFMSDEHSIRLFEEISKLDSIRNLLIEGLSGSRKPLDIKFYEMYPAFGIELQKLNEQVKLLQNMGYNLAVHLPISNLRNRGLKEEIKKRKPQETHSKKNVSKKNSERIFKINNDSEKT